MIWDAIGYAPRTLKEHLGSVKILAFSPDGTQIAFGSWDKTITLWDTGTGYLRKTLKGHSRSVNTVAFSPNGMKIVSGSGAPYRRNRSR
ncbi:G-protein beta WD 40 repeat-containing protein [Penicillium taxi]|uniref:G-protein beta WD 40 repeat-containing protein n=1 Tax=Penicillium taxi TaxID=168475 RepID=UPI0025456916|nr:G-protein beta WD 40 repeat-containing protein [Penicillium taxi]KAJ5893446.1 G-protein beta WD 40 repeat-containing protein [Penicillium taxi]